MPARIETNELNFSFREKCRRIKKSFLRCRKKLHLNKLLISKFINQFKLCSIKNQNHETSFHPFHFCRSGCFLNINNTGPGKTQHWNSCRLSKFRTFLRIGPFNRYLKLCKFLCWRFQREQDYAIPSLGNRIGILPERCKIFGRQQTGNQIPGTSGTSESQSWSRLCSCWRSAKSQAFGKICDK
jgi:hypothetical protein